MSKTRHLQAELRFRIEVVAQHCRRQRAFSHIVRLALSALIWTGLFVLLLIAIEWSSSGVLAASLGYLVGIVVLVWFLCLAPLRKPIPLRQVALFIDEHHPELENRIISTVELVDNEEIKGSAWIVEEFLKDTVPMVRAQPLWVDLKLNGLGLRVAFIVILVLGSLGLLSGFNQQWMPGVRILLPEPPAVVVPLSFSVEPGDIRIRRGESQTILVKGRHLDNRSVSIQWRDSEGEWFSSEMVASSETGEYFALFENLSVDREYRVSADNESSPIFTIDVWLPPNVESIDLHYRYPEYTNLSPLEVTNSGDILAWKGSRVDVRLQSNKAIVQAEMVLSDDKRIALQSSDGYSWHTDFMVQESDEYTLLLRDEEGLVNEYPTPYTITAQIDQAPVLNIEFPHGDSQITLLEELVFDFAINDDIGLVDYGVQYEIAGKEPVQISLNSSEDIQESAEGYYEIALEDFELSVGDMITWSVWARDGYPSRSDFEGLSDPYFMEIRPFKMWYSEALSTAGMESGKAEDMAQKQRDIQIASWNLRKNVQAMKGDEYLETLTIIQDEQQSLLDQVKEAQAGSYSELLIALDDAMGQSVERLEKSLYPMPEGDLSAAIIQQQIASSILLKMRGDKTQVQQSQQQASAGGGEQEQSRDMSELEMARNKNYYEEENKTKQQQAQQEDVLNRLKELAQRQEHINESLAELISELQAAKTEKEREEIMRKLERLKEELKKNLKRSDEASKEINSMSTPTSQKQSPEDSMAEAREQMERTLEQLEQNNLQDARSSGSKAQKSLDEAKQSLEQLSGEAIEQEMDKLKDMFNTLRERQEEMVANTQDALDEMNTPDLSGDAESKKAQQERMEERDALAEELETLLEDASEIAERSKESQEAMARKLGDWLRETSRDGILEDMDVARQLQQFNMLAEATKQEKEIGKKLDEAAQKLAEVAEALTDGESTSMQQALNALESLKDEQAGENAEGNPESSSDSESKSGDGNSNGPTEQEQMREFAEREYKDWQDALRDAQSLLPEDSPVRDQLGRIRDSIGGLRRDFRDNAAVPQFELFTELVMEPLAQSKETLERLIEYELGQEEFMLLDEGAVPEQYRQEVADYFKQLSEAETKAKAN